MHASGTKASLLTGDGEHARKGNRLRKEKFSTTLHTYIYTYACICISRILGCE